MGIVTGHRGPKPWLTEKDLPVFPAAPTTTKKKCSNLMVLFVSLVFIAQIAFLSRLDMVKNASLMNSLTGSFYPASPVEDVGSRLDGSSEADSCEDFLEREDAVHYSRDFNEKPILVSGAEKDWETCSVKCVFGRNANEKLDAAFGLHWHNETASVHRSMESSAYYGENDVSQALRLGYKVVMTTSLSSNVPVGYFSWAEYDIMAPLQPKVQTALAAAFISNCAARNFRIKALTKLLSKVKIDSYGRCHRNRPGNVNKVETLKSYKFSLAFENSNEEDYVTEKYFQSLVAGAVPVVVGAPNIQDFAPSNDSILHIRDLKDVDAIADAMKFLAENDDSYSRAVRWKHEGPSDSFKALVDMAVVHSSCRLCIHLATMIRQEEEKNTQSFHNRPCKCVKASGTVYHFYVRERGRFETVSIFLRSENLTMEGLESAVVMKFESMKHVPIWKKERPPSIRGGDKLKVYRVYPLGMTQRQALYTFRFNSAEQFRRHVVNNPCPNFEVIFV